MYGRSTMEFTVDAPQDVVARFAPEPVSGPMRSEADQYAAIMINDILRSAETEGGVYRSGENIVQISTYASSQLIDVLHFQTLAEMRGNQ